ncbi:MAG: M6 family metalloprotease domain-containing protein [Alistipes sp.]|nr:M6 family metalloprotease domain-containing protein [Candidatus Minthomonas equi]
MRRAVIILVSLLLPLMARATAAYPYPVTVSQPDGTTLRILINGDEFCRWTTDIWGNPVRKGNDGFWHTVSAPSALELSSIRQYNLDRMLPPTSAENIPPLTKGTGNADTDIKVLVIPIQFQDIKFQKTDYRDYLDNKLNVRGYSEDGATGSARDYFEANFIGRRFTFDVCDIITLKHNSAYYGSNDETVPARIRYDVSIPQMVKEACTILESRINFQNYDLNGDKAIDHMIFVYAGYNEAESGNSDDIWSHEWDLSSQKLKFDGVFVGLYAAASELRGASGNEDAGIGTFCHELSHTFGLKDLYDVNYGGEGLCKCLWRSLSIMDYGNFNNNGNTPPYYCAIDRELAGVAPAGTLGNDAQITLSPIHETGCFYRLNTEKEGEYFLLEARRESGWDRYIGGHGMLIYHIDKSSRFIAGIQASIRWTENIINTVAGHECADLVEAFDEAESIRQVFFPGQGNVTEFGPVTLPALESWNGESLKLKISNISESEDCITFHVSSDQSERLFKVIDPEVTPYQTEADFDWKSEKDHLKWGVRWKEVHQSQQEYLETTVHETHCLIKGLKTDTEYQAEIFHIGHSGNGDTTSVLFSTKGYSSRYPCIYIPRNTFTKGETLTPKIQNLREDIRSIKWYLDGLYMESESVVLEGTGEPVLKAVITYSADGSSEIITKTITVK